MTRIANDNSDATRPKEPDDNTIQPFQLEVSGLRGRVVRLGSVLDDILAAHAYPEPVAQLLAETVATALLLSSMLKYEGVFTLQTSSSGPVRTIVADVTTAGAVRAYAGYDAETIDAMLRAPEKPDGGLYAGFNLAQVAGKGYLAFTVDQGEFTDRYQGIVELSGESLAESVSHYFAQSEQIGTSLKVGVSFEGSSGWRAGAIMLQRMPDPSVSVTEKEGEAIVPFRPELAAEKDEDWARSSILLQSVTASELAGAGLHSHDILLRLFHEEGVRIFTPLAVFKSCRCSADRVSRVLATLSPDDLDHAAEDGVIRMTCEFCSRTYAFNRADMTCSEVDASAQTH